MIDVASAEAAPLLADLLSGGTAIRIQVTGRSMRPLLQGGEVVEVRPVGPHAIHWGDLVLARQSSGALLMHRVLRIRREAAGAQRLLTMGDAAQFPDPPMRTADVLGKVCVVERVRVGGAVRRITLDAMPWRLYGNAVVLRQLVKLAVRRASAHMRPHLVLRLP